LSRLFIALHLDEEVSVVLAKVPRNLEFDATTTQKAGMAGASDRQQLDHATTAGPVRLSWA